MSLLVHHRHLGHITSIFYDGIGTRIWFQEWQVVQGFKVIELQRKPENIVLRQETAGRMLEVVTTVILVYELPCLLEIGDAAGWGVCFRVLFDDLNGTKISSISSQMIS